MKDGSKIAGSIAIGKNTIARTGSVMLGDHSYTGKLGDIEINPANAMTYNDGIYSTTLGAGAYNSGSLAAVTGALSIASGEDTQNTGATIYGSMNSIESATSSSSYSGVASSVLGFANRTQNANAALIWGTGNEVTNSVEKIGIDTDWNNVSVAEAQKKAIEAMQSSKYAGGSVMAIGGGNKADYATYSQLTGVQNKVTGTEAKAAKYDFVNGYKNTVTNASDVTVIGIENEVTADGNKVIGDNHKVSGKNNVIFGSADKLTETTVNNAVVLGHNAKVTGEGGIALGAGSVADRANAVSVGSKGTERQIINVKAGVEDTDAVNVSQLKKATANANKGWKLSTEGGAANLVASEATVDFSGQKDAGNHQNITVSNDGNNVKIGLASELHNVTGVVNGDSRVTLGMNTASISNGTAQMVIFNDGIYLSKPNAEQKDVQIHGVAAGKVSSASTDAINGSQLHQTNQNVAQNKADIAQNKADIKNIDNRVTNVEEVAKKHTTVTKGDNIVVSENTNADGGKEYKVSLKNDITLAGDDPEAMVSISGSKGTIWASGSVTAGSVVAGKVIMDGDTATVSGLSNKTTAYEGFATTGKAATEEQLKEVATEAGKHTQVKAGTNVSVVPGETADGTHVYTVNADGTTVSGDSNVVVTAGEKDANNVTNYGVKLNKDLKGIESVSNGNAKLTLSSHPFFGTTAELTNGQASVSLMGGSTKINGKVEVRQDGTIGGVTAGRFDKDAVNVSQLNKVATEAGKHSVVTEGANITVTPEQAADGRMQYNVALKNDILLSGENAAFVNISGSKGTIWTSGSVAAGNVIMDGTTATVSGLGNTTTAYDGFANGEGKAATEEQLKEISKVADNANQGWNLSTNGDAASKVAPGETVDFSGDKNISVSNNGKDVKVELNKDIDVNSVQTNALNAKYNLSVGTANENGIMPFFVNSNGAFYGANNNFSVDKDGKVTATAGEIGNVVLDNGVFTGHSALRDGELFVGDASGNYSQITTKGAKLGKVTVAEDGKISGVAAGAVTADSTDAVNGSQLHAVATEAGKHSKVVNGSNINVEETDVDGQKIYKVNLNKDIMLGDLTGKYVNISGTNGTIETTGYIATKDRVYADKGGKLADIDVTGDKISNGASSIVLDGSNVKVNDKVTIDQNGNIAGVNSLQTNALNSKYNLSVGTMAENGIMPFFVNSTGDFYAAHNKFHVDKDGKVTATAGEIGNVVLQNGVYYGHSTLQDGSLLLTDDNGNHSYIDAKSAKLGKVTVAEDGKISGVAAGAVTADSTDAVNGSQLHAVATEAGKHSKVVNGSNINVEEFDNDGQKIYKVNLNKDIMLGDLTGKNVSISGTNGTIETTGYIATKDRVYADKGAKLADIDVTGDTISNGDAKLALNGAAGTAGMINGKGASVYMQDGYTVINSKVAFDQNGKISGVAAGAVTADSTDAVNGSQLHAVATEAGKHSKVVNGSNINVEETTVDGQKVYKVNLNNNIMVGDVTGKYVSISGTNGTIEATGAIATKDRVYADKGAKLADIDVTGNTISNGGATLTLGAMGGMVSEFANGQGASVKLFGDATIINGKVNVYNDGRIAGVAAGINDNDAVNVGQLKEAVEAGNTDTHIKPGEYGVGADNTVNMDVVDKNGNKVDTVTIKDVAKASDVGDVNNIASDIKNQDGSHTTVVDAVNNLNNKVGDLQYSKVEKGEIEDGDSTTTAIGKLDQKLTDVAATAAKHTKVEGSSNITVTNTAKEGEAANYKVELNKDIDVDTVTANSVTTGQTVMNNDGLKVGKDVSVTATAVTAGKTSISDEGVKVGDNTYISDKGLNANGQYITNVKAGEADTDAVNYGQLKDTNNHIDRVENQVVNNTNRINKLGSRVNKVGAGAAALAALHPMDFDPDDKLTFSAGYGNYAGENAAAIGAYYRPDEKVMFSVAGTVGNGENMVNAGVSFALDRTNHVSNSRTALAREVIDLRGQLAVMGAKMAKMEKAFGMLDETKTKLFPDVPANHWAYEYIAKLAGNGYIEGYPDGNFGGDRLMTRYEFAAMLYRAIENGAALEEKIIKEFEPELGRIRVDRISGEDGDRDKIERVRVNDTKGERDHYGNKLAK